MRIGFLVTLVLSLFLAGGCGSGGMLPQDTGTWAIVVDVTPSVEMASDASKTQTEDGTSAGTYVDRELSQARSLRADGFNNEYYEIVGLLNAKWGVDKLPENAQAVGSQDSPNSDYVACIKEIIDRHASEPKGHKVRLSIFGDFRHVSGHENYQNWTPTPAAFGGRRMDGWQVELIVPNYLSGADSGAESRAQKWADCLKSMGATVTVSTASAFPKE